MSTESVMHTRSGYYTKSLSVAYPHDENWWSWGIVFNALRRYEETGEHQPSLPPDIQRPGAAVGLAVGLGFRQLGLAAEDWRYVMPPWKRR